MVTLPACGTRVDGRLLPCTGTKSRPRVQVEPYVNLCRGSRLYRRCRRRATTLTDHSATAHSATGHSATVHSATVHSALRDATHDRLHHALHLTPGAGSATGFESERTSTYMSGHA